jgi:alpha-beta hydrolase superfamily lysophospholipase
MKINNMETVEFKSDDYILTGTLHLSKDTPTPMVIGCHGLMADRNSPKQVGLAQACTRRGIGYFRFDHRGCGDSQGEFDHVTSLKGRREDLFDAIRFLHSTGCCNGDIGLFGSSMGGAVCLSIYDAVKVAAMVTVAAPLHSRFPHAGDHPQNMSFNISRAIRGVRNILIFHGEQDEIVPVSHADTLYALASRPKKLIIQPNGDHRMSDSVHQKAFIRESVDWFAKSLLV